VVTVWDILGKVRSEGRTILSEVESKQLIKQAGISVSDTRLATFSEEAISISHQFGFPVVLKISSAEVLHKSDAGGVKVGLRTSKQVGKAYNDILKAIQQRYPQAMIQGVSVQKMARPGVEVIVDVTYLEELLLKISDFVERNPEVKELDLNPIIAYGNGAIAVDARIVLEESS
jgi:acyl-CoA synthetase (NDP forming)